MRYPAVMDPTLVGTHPASAKAGGGYVWDEVLEYRVRCHPEKGAPDEADGSDYYEEAAEFARTRGRDGLASGRPPRDGGGDANCALSPWR